MTDSETAKSGRGSVWERGERIHEGAVDIHDRTFAFAVRVLRLVRSLPNDLSGRTVARQLARSGTSVGANVEEAQGIRKRNSPGGWVSLAQRPERRFTGFG